MLRSARAMAHARGQRKEIQLTAAAPRQVSEARIGRETHRRKQPARLEAIVLHGYAAIHSLERSAASHRGLLRQATTVAAQALPTAAALTNHRSGRTTARSPTVTAATRSLGRTIHLRTSRTHRPGLTPHLAVAIPLRHTPTPHRHRVAATAAGVAAIGAGVAAEAHTAVGAPPLTAGTNLFANSSARLDLPGGLLLIEVGALRVFLPQQMGFSKISRFRSFVLVRVLPVDPRVANTTQECVARNSLSCHVLDEVTHFLSGVCCFDKQKEPGRCPAPLKC